MKKFLVVCLSMFFVFAGFFGAAGTARKTFTAAGMSAVSDGESQNTEETAALPPGVSIRYRDSDETGARTTQLTVNSETENYIKHHDPYGALYKSTGYLVFGLPAPSVGIVDGINVTIEHVGDTKIDNGENTTVEVLESYIGQNEHIFYWNYYALGKYNIEINIWYRSPSHTHGPECVVFHEDDDGFDIICPYWRHCTCGEDCETCNGDCLECFCNSEIVAPLKFNFVSVCKSAEPEFGVLFVYKNQTYTESSRLATGTKFEVRASLRNTNVYWNETSLVYTPDCGLLTKSDDGKYLILKSGDKGEHDLRFIMEFQFLKTEEDGTICQIPKEVTVSLKMTFFKPSKPITIWDALLGAVALGALAGTAWFITKLSKDVEKR